MHTSSITAEAALAMLVEGNTRYVNNVAMHPHQNAERREEVLGGQHPFAALLSCADSRVPPEVFFDQGVGDLFIIRNAGNLLDDVVLGSIEYGVEHLGIPLVVVLGHTKCGAVTAAVQSPDAPGHIDSVVKAIQPAVEAAKGMEGDAVLNATLANVRMIVDELIKCQPIIAEMVEHGHVKVVGALYHLDSGKVEWL